MRGSVADRLGGVPLRADLVDDVRLFLDPVGSFSFALEHPERAVVTPLAARADPGAETLDGLALQREVQAVPLDGIPADARHRAGSLSPRARIGGWRPPQPLR